MVQATGFMLNQPELIVLTKYCGFLLLIMYLLKYLKKKKIHLVETTFLLELI